MKISSGYFLAECVVQAFLEYSFEQKNSSNQISSRQHLHETHIYNTNKWWKNKISVCRSTKYAKGEYIKIHLFYGRIITQMMWSNQLWNVVESTQAVV